MDLSEIEMIEFRDVIRICQDLQYKRLTCGGLSKQEQDTLERSRQKKRFYIKKYTQRNL